MQIALQANATHEKFLDFYTTIADVLAIHLGFVGRLCRAGIRDLPFRPTHSCYHGLSDRRNHRKSNKNCRARNDNRSRISSSHYVCALFYVFPLRDVIIPATDNVRRIRYVQAKGGRSRAGSYDISHMCVLCTCKGFVNPLAQPSTGSQ